jgi:hypothetical protein
LHLNWQFYWRVICDKEFLSTLPACHPLSSNELVRRDDFSLLLAQRASEHSLEHLWLGHGYLMQPSSKTYEWIDRNPIKLVRQSADRQTVSDVLTALLSELEGRYYVMTFMTAVMDLRVSELLAIKWEDCHFDSAEIRLNRGIVSQHVGPLKTEASQKPIVLHSEFGGCASGLARQMPLQSQYGLCFCIRRDERHTTTVA